jgi:hypothetical protein
MPIIGQVFVTLNNLVQLRTVFTPVMARFSFVDDYRRFNGIRRIKIQRGISVLKMEAADSSGMLLIC